MKILNLIARIVTGLVFVFSGTVKAIDPMGSAYMFSDYFQAFNMDFLSSLSLPFAIILCTVEFITGFFILTGIMYRTGTILVLALMLFSRLSLFLLP